MGHDWTTRGTHHRVTARGRARDLVRGFARDHVPHPRTSPEDGGGDLPAPGGRDAVVEDRGRAADLRSAVFCSLALFALIVLVDFGAGTLSAVRAGLWAGLAVLLYVILYPARVTAGPGWLAVRGPVRRGHVCLDLLTTARVSETVAARLVLCDSLGNRVEFDPKVLAENPLLLHRLDAGARASRASGLLRSGSAELSRLLTRLDGREAKAVFEASGLR
ncbi:hypothetical protein [Streptomyces flavofungini]|uniref:hypothetical protein n=1 Tax=Streptomyces flavofungini TaxID=68200 RepID=UPI0025B0C4F9|nr:hypothetical protein [Streptomyces flavofungini]WJV48833.1 hypothetical protein QUY26_26980 [Streptomyces flavofungini]